MKDKKQGFTLVELSVVIVIIGMIILAIFTGRELIKSTELNSIASELNKFGGMYNAYKLKYNAIAGDHDRAWDYFGTACRATAALCNGDGDGSVGDINEGEFGGESALFFKHAYLAGLYNQNLSGAGGGCNKGVNYPEMSIKHATYTPYTWDKKSFFMIGQYLCCDYGGSWAAIMSIGSCKNSPFPWAYPPSMTPKEAKKIDEKIDDGMPGTGNVISALRQRYCMTSNNMLTARYNVGNTQTVCKPGLIMEDNLKQYPMADRVACGGINLAQCPADF